MPDLKLNYLQVSSQHKCMALGGAIAYDSLLAYTFINLAGYGKEKSGYLSTLLRDDP